MKLNNKTLSVIIALFMLIFVTVINLSFAYGNGDAQYGTEEYGIYTKDASTSVFSLDPVDFLKNGDFNEGLKYWAPSYTVVNQNTAYYASIEDGALKLSPNGTSGNKVVTSAAITIPDSLKGKKMTVLMWYKANANGRFQIGVYTDNLTNIYNDGYGNTYVCGPGTQWKFGAFNFVAPTNGSISIYLKADGALSFDLFVERFALGVKNDDGTYTMFTDSFDSESVLLDKEGRYYYGTEEEGIYTTNYGTSVFYRRPLDYLHNGDFSQGLKFWAPSYTVEKQNTAYYASVENGALKLSPDGVGGNKAVTSVAVKIPDTIKGRELKVLMWYRSDAAAVFNFGIYKDNYTNICKESDTVSCAPSDKWRFSSFTFTADAPSVSVYLRALGQYKYNLYIDKIAFAVKNEDGSYSLFDNGFDNYIDETVSQKGFNSDYTSENTIPWADPVIGSYEDGIITGKSYGIYGWKAADEFKNSDFKNGLMHWATIGGVSPTIYATPKKDADGTPYIKFTATEYGGIISQPFRIAEAKEGDRLILMADYRGTDKFSMSLEVSNMIAKDEKKIKAIGCTAVYEDSQGWNTAITGSDMVIGTVNLKDIKLYGDSLYFTVRVTAAGTDCDIDITKIRILKIGDDKKYYNLDGTVYEDAHINASVDPTVGSYEKGIVTGKSYGIYGWPAADEFKNGNFKDGLMHWATIGGVSPTVYASPKTDSDGTAYIHFKATEYGGIISQPFRIYDIKEGERLIVMCDYRGDSNFQMTLAASNMIPRDEKKVRAIGCTVIYESANSWNTAMTGSGMVVGAVNLKDEKLYGNSLYFTVLINASGSDCELDITNLRILKVGSDGEYYNLDGTKADVKTDSDSLEGVELPDFNPVACKITGESDKEIENSAARVDSKNNMALKVIIIIAASCGVLLAGVITAIVIITFRKKKRAN